VRRLYPTLDAAARRVQVLSGQGIWPGIRTMPGGWQLTCDPDDDDGQADARTAAKEQASA
jgi:uncharacterized protein YbdZ (MbtH family)